MKRFYIECTPIRRGLTGREYLAQHVDEAFPGSKFHPMFNNGIIEFGYLEGSDDGLCNILSFCEKSFAIKRLFVEEFRGAAQLYWIAPEPLEGDDPMTVAEYLALYSVPASTSLLNDAKSYKIKLLKEKVKKEFFDYNDIVANLAKEIMLLTEYRDSLDASQTARLDAALASMASIYSIDDCLDAIEEDIAAINSVMPDYYSIKTSIQNALDIDALNNIDIIGS